MSPQHCPNTARCPFYANGLDYTQDNRTDIIIRTMSKSEALIYSCLALIALDDAETGFPVGHELAEELSDSSRVSRITCPLNSLNAPGFLEAQVNDLLNISKKQNV